MFVKKKHCHSETREDMSIEQHLKHLKDIFDKLVALEARVENISRDYFQQPLMYKAGSKTRH